MISSLKFVLAGLLLITLTIFFVGVHSKATETEEENERFDSAIERAQGKSATTEKPEKMKMIYYDPDEDLSLTTRKPKKFKTDYFKLKRDVRDLSGLYAGDSPKKAAYGEDPPEKAPTKKRNKAVKAKKLMDDVIDVDRTTTQKPKETHSQSEKGPESTAKPHSRRSGKETTKKPAKKDEEAKNENSKDEKSKDENESADVDGEKKEKRSDKSTTEKPPVASRKHKMKTEEKLKVANERWLQNQEVVAIEHMLAGVYDWMKVLKQTKGKTFNKKTAGELFDKVNNELAGMLSEQNKPTKLVSYYRQMKIK